MNKIFNYRDFGAKGDGVTDDFDAIVKTHEAANAAGGVVEATAGDTYYIGNTDKIAIIRTDVDFKWAKFIIDDTKVSHLENSRSLPIFKVCRDSEPWDVPVPQGMSLSEGQTNIGITFDKPCMLKLEDAEHRDFIRYGVNEDKGQLRQEMILVDEQGNVCERTPIQHMYASVGKITAYPIDDKPLTIKNAKMVTVANNPRLYDPEWTGAYYYYRRSFYCERSNTLIRNVDHDVIEEGEYGAPYEAFFTFFYAYNTTLMDCKIFGHYEYKFFMPDGRINAMGSYEFIAGQCVEPKFIGLFQTTDITDRANTHGVMGSYNCRNLYLENCYIDRFDSHKGMYGATIRNCTLGFDLYLIGGGPVLVENVTRLVGSSYIGLRADYNGIFRGDITIKGGVCRKPGAIVGGIWFRHDNGLANYVGVNVTVDGLVCERDDTVVYSIQKATSDALTDEVNPLIPPKSVTLKNMRPHALCPEAQADAFAGVCFDTSECFE